MPLGRLIRSSLRLLLPAVIDRADCATKSSSEQHDIPTQDYVALLSAADCSSLSPMIWRWKQQFLGLPESPLHIALDVFVHGGDKTGHWSVGVMLMRAE